MKYSPTCSYCRSNSDSFRLYVRTRKLIENERYNYKRLTSDEATTNKHLYSDKRSFEPIGWYCKNCKAFQTEDMIASHVIKYIPR